MTMLAPVDAAHLTRIRTDDGAERGPIGAGELTGRFTAMLEQLNGVDGTSSGADASAPEPLPAVGSTATPRLGLGAVSVFAQITDDAEAGTLPGEQAQDATQAVQTALRGDNTADFRWLTTLLTQNDVEATGLA